MLTVKVHNCLFIYQSPSGGEKIKKSRCEKFSVAYRREVEFVLSVTDLLFCLFHSPEII